MKDADVTSDGKRLLRAIDLSLGYNGKAVLEHVDLEIQQGDFCFLLGPNGSGKTSLLNVVLGTLRPRSGSLWLDPVAARRQRIGFVPQRCDLNPALPTTVREFVLLGAVGAGLARRDEGECLDWALARANLAAMGSRNYWSLSGGERQRALLARALVRRPTFLVLDEPTANLDLWAEARLVALLATLNREEGLSLLVVTHDLELAARHATRVAVIYEGTVSSGAPSKVLEPHTIERVFGVRLDLSRG
jgi:ABC-type Mn2+/Zn2+ transport system ATPase subunit